MGWRWGATGEEPRRQEQHGCAAGTHGGFPWCRGAPLQYVETSEISGGMHVAVWHAQDAAKWSAIRNCGKTTITALRRRKITGWTSFQKRVFVPFQTSCHNSFVDTRIYFYKCQRGPSFYFSISLAKGVASLSSPWPCYSTAVSQPERPSFC